MVFWGCQIFKINPHYDIHVKNILLEYGKQYLFEKKENLSFYMYVDKLQKALKAVKIPIIDIDTLVPIYNREQGNIVAKETVRFQLCIFEEPVQLSNMLAIFSNDRVIRTFRSAMRIIASEKVRSVDSFLDIQKITPLLPVKFRLKEQEAEIRKHLPNIRAFSVRKIKDLYVRGASLKGVELESTREYQKYVQDEIISGYLTFFGMPIRGRVYNMSTEGKIWTREGQQLPNELPEVDIVSEVLQKLLESDAIVIYQL